MDKRATALSMIQMAWPKFTPAQGLLYDKQLKDIPDELLFLSLIHILSLCVQTIHQNLTTYS